MPTLKEFRAILRKGIGNTTIRDITHDTRTKFEKLASTLEDELPDVEPDDEISTSKTGLDVDALRRKKKEAPPKYTISLGGKDAIVHFGEYNGLTLSMIYDKNLPYMTWLIDTFSKHRDPVSEKFVDVVKYVVTSEGT